MLIRYPATEYTLELILAVNSLFLARSIVGVVSLVMLH